MTLRFTGSVKKILMALRKRRMFEKRGTGDKDVCPAPDKLTDIFRTHAAIDLDRNILAAISIQKIAHGADFLNGCGDEGLSRKAGIDTHQQHKIEVVSEPFQKRRIRGRIQGDAGAAALLADCRERALQMRLRLGMDNDEVGPRLCERSDIAARGVDHHVHIKKKPALAAQSSNNRLTKGEIWTEGERIIFPPLC